MASWSEIEEAAPELASRSRAAFDAHVHKTIATLRRDGSPRISGIELIFSGGDVWFGSMWKAVKALDLRRDPRFALHSGSADPPEWFGDAKIAGRAEEVGEQETLDRVLADSANSEGEEEGGQRIGSMHLFRADIDELVFTGLDEAREKLVIESWRADRGLRRVGR